MQIKKFVGKNVVEAMDLVKKDFGNDAVILKTHKIKTGGFLGFFKKDAVEILAALDIHAKEKETQKEKNILNRALVQKGSQAYSKYEQNVKEPARPKRVEFKADQENPVDNFKEIIKKSSQTPESDMGFERENELAKEIEELKGIVSLINKKVSFTEEDKDVKIKYKKYSEELKNIGLSEDTIVEFFDDIQLEIGERDELYKELYRFFKKKSFFKNGFEFEKKINIFIGTTGVGKTTTLAKLASKVVLETDKKIGFLTLDTYRIAAVDQLKTYAEILNSPIEVAYDFEDVENSIERLKNRELIFVDTAGRSHNNKEHMNELKQFIDRISEYDINKFLVISANQSLEDIEKIIKRHEFLDEYSIIITKLDETDRMGIPLEIMNRSKKPISHVTFGQNVPDDLESFSLMKLIKDILKESI